MEVSPYIYFLRYCLDESCPEPTDCDNLEWEGLMTWASQQAVIGVLFGGIERLSNSLSIPISTKMQWIGLVQRIEQQNRLINHRCYEVVSELEKEGFRCCVLKGQGNATMYPNPLRRMPGDIDVWVKGKTTREAIVFARQHYPQRKACYHHVDFGKFKEVEVEMHYRPTFMNNLVSNRKLQEWIRKHEDEQFLHYTAIDGGEKISTPTWSFNVVFQLSHIYRHVIQGGIGLRQIIDYYYLLKSEERGKRRDVEDTLSELGLKEIAGAVMWVLYNALGLPEHYLVANVDEKRGRFLYNEIMQGGNFGFFDHRVKHSNNKLQRNLNRLKQDFRLLKYFPSECLWEPLFRVYHWAWRVVY